MKDGIKTKKAETGLVKMKASVVAGHDQKLSIDDANAKSKLELLCGGQMITEITVYILTGSGFHGSKS